MKRLVRAALLQIRWKVRRVVGAKLFMTCLRLNSIWKTLLPRTSLGVWYCDKLI